MAFTPRLSFDTKEQFCDHHATSQSVACLCSLHELALEFVQNPDTPSKDVGFIRQLEQNLIMATTESISVADVRSDIIGRQHHQIIIRRFFELLEAQSVGPFHMQEVSDRIGVSSRTMRLACQEHLGISPMQYLLQCRMQLARRALQEADPDITRVTDIATELGFWELGRFSVKYRQAFGETPSSTLRVVGSLGHESVPSHYGLT